MQLCGGKNTLLVITLCQQKPNWLFQDWQGRVEERGGEEREVSLVYTPEVHNSATTILLYFKENLYKGTYFIKCGHRQAKLKFGSRVHNNVCERGSCFISARSLRLFSLLVAGYSSTVCWLYSLSLPFSLSLSLFPPSLSRSLALSLTLPAPDVMAKKPRWQGTAFSWRWVSLWVYYNFVIKISRKKKTHNLLPPFLRGGKREGGNLSPDRQKRKRSKLTTRSCQNQDIRFQPRELLALGLCI